MHRHKRCIVILDFGSQYTQLIARKIRSFKIYSEILPYSTPASKIRSLAPAGLILSGGPCGVYNKNAPKPPDSIWNMDIPILGICYGMQLIVHKFGGIVKSGEKGEYGKTMVHIHKKNLLFNRMVPESENGYIQVWMSHGDRLTSIPKNFIPTAATTNNIVAAIKHRTKPLYGIQFHPEVSHTPQGEILLKNFSVDICKAETNWTPQNFIQSAISKIREKVKDGMAICALSGGVDSSVASVLAHKALGNRLTCIFVDNGLLRENEAKKVITTFQNNFHMNLISINASEKFLSRLRGITDPEKKRKIIGNEFIHVFEKESKKIGNVTYLVQGTLYPDVIESVSVKGPASTIKSHHNVGGLPEKMNLKLIEPLRELFKDEVRKVGLELGLPEFIIWRHPFPGPGLAIRIVGEITPERLNILRKADAIVIEEIKKHNLYKNIWQAFAVLLPIKSVGVMGDERTYEHVLALRAVNSTDGMTADWVKIPYEVLSAISNRIINEVKGINRVVYDISSKPPSTIEWE